jgi:BASS family bile acid:Na+ symporter
MALGVLANFVFVPLLAYGVAHVLSLERDYQLGLFLAASAGGAPLQIRLTQIASGSAPYSAGLLVLLLLVTIVYMPLVVPLEAPEADVSAAAIAKPLILSMLLPLGAGLLVRAGRPPWAARIAPPMARVANISLYALIALTLVLHLRSLLALFGTGAILASALVIGGAFLIGYVLRGFRGEERGEAALATAQRNYAAAIVVATQSFTRSPNVLVMVVAISLVSMALLFPAAHVLGRRAQRPTS